MEYDHDQFEVVSVAQGAMHTDVRSFFHHNTKISDLQVSGVVFSDEFEGNEVASITIRAKQNGTIKLTDLELTFRDANNDPIATTFSLQKNSDGIIPSSYALHQNYPNPFNPTTTIEFALRESSDYTLTIYNVAGQSVETFVGHSDAGIVSLTWNASSMGSGVYFYKLETADFNDTKKMVLLK